MDKNYSIGLPVRNEENNIIGTLEDILYQTIPSSEIHVCVNGSTDNTYKLATDMAKTEKNINVLTSEPGKANAWNRIIKECSNNYVMFCDGDVSINHEAAENMLNRFEKKPELVIVGGFCKYYPREEKTLFSKYFTRDFSNIPETQSFLSGRLYMMKSVELFDLAKDYGIELMPADIINEDGLLDFITKGRREIEYSAYNLAHQIDTFHDWRITHTRILAGQKQIRERYPAEKYPQLYSSTNKDQDNNSMVKRFERRIKKFKEMPDWRKRIGVTSMFFITAALNTYYKISDNIEYNPVWQEPLSTKKKISDMNLVESPTI